MYGRLAHRRRPIFRFFPWFLLCAGLVVLLVWVAGNRRFLRLLFSPRSDYDAMIDVAAERHDVDPRLLKALVWKESGFDANAVGSRGEIGLTQLRMEHGAVAEWASARGEPPPPKGVLFRPEINLDIGAWYLSRALRHWEGFDRQYELALSEYNAGRTGMSPWIPESPDGEVLSNITIQSTKEYVRAVMERYRLYVAEREAE